MDPLPSMVYLGLILVFIASVPLTFLSRYAWNSRGLFLLFSAIGVCAFIVLAIMVWPNI